VKMLARLELRFSFDSALTLLVSDAVFTLATLSTLLSYHVSNLMAYHVCCLRSVDALYWCLARDKRLCTAVEVKNPSLISIPRSMLRQNLLSYKLRHS